MALGLGPVMTLPDAVRWLGPSQGAAGNVHLGSALAPGRPASILVAAARSIAGAEEFGDGSADSVSGLATPDDYTVEITLAAPDRRNALHVRGTPFFEGEWTPKRSEP